MHRTGARCQARHLVCPACGRERYAAHYRRARRGRLTCPDCGCGAPVRAFAAVRRLSLVDERVSDAITAELRGERAA